MLMALLGWQLRMLFLTLRIWLQISFTHTHTYTHSVSPSLCLSLSPPCTLKLQTNSTTYSFSTLGPALWLLPKFRSCFSWKSSTVGSSSFGSSRSNCSSFRSSCILSGHHVNVKEFSLHYLNVDTGRVCGRQGEMAITKILWFNASSSK